ncbi:hypothetical protein BGZ54_000036 [Gamsiella multidivaricata]|nr:hypothetical protein BGZ54_000036 [Gamsiella multidivaricata]
MNHRKIAARNLVNNPRIDLHSSTRPVKQHQRPVINNVGPHDRTKDTAGVEQADRLLAAILVFYKDAIINSIAPLYLPSLLKDLAAYIKSVPPQTTQLISKGSTDLENDSANVVLAAIDSEMLIPLTDRLFHAIVNLSRPCSSFKESIELNAGAIFNVVIASIMEGSETHDCERLLTLCIYLKDTENCYPLRSLASTVCLDVISVSSLPLYARTSILRFILGPANFILHHLETRIVLSQRIQDLLQEDLYDDIEFRSAVKRIARKIGLRKPSSIYEQQKCRLYRYLDLVVLDPTGYCQKDIIAEVLYYNLNFTLMDTYQLNRL